MAGTNDLQLQLRDGTNTYTFDYDGRLRIEQEYQYNENPEPPELRQIIERWHVDSARIVGADQETAWDNLQTFLGHLEDSTSTPLTNARLVRSPSGAAVAERVIGSTGWEGFRVENIELGDEPVEELEASEMRTVWPVSMVITAVKPFEDSYGIVSWEQTVRSTYDRAALHTLEWETSISVKEGATSSALTQAALYAAIPISCYGNTYVWDTNSPNGFDVEEGDPDTRRDLGVDDCLDTIRTPTKLKVVSRIKQKGITVGSPSAGNSVGEVSYVIIEEKEGSVSRTITEASAEGPGALAWVNSKRPNGNVKTYTIRDEQAARRAFGRWVVQVSDPNSANDKREVRVTISNGGEYFEFAPVPGHDPQFIPGASRPFRADVIVRLVYEGERPALAEMLLPPLLPDPWVLHLPSSREDAGPRLSNPGSDTNAATWVREAHAVYFAPAGLALNQFDQQFNPDAPGVESYFVQ